MLSSVTVNLRSSLVRFLSITQLLRVFVRMFLEKLKRSGSTQLNGVALPQELRSAGNEKETEN